MTSPASPSPSEPFPIPSDEEERLRDLERFGLLGHRSDIHLDRLVELARLIFDVPMAAISLVTANRQWFLAEKGLNIRETPRGVAFCAHAIMGSSVLVVPNALKDERFCSNPLVTSEPQIRFYAGAPLRSSSGHNLGTLCVIDCQPMEPTAAQIRQLELLSQLVMRELDLRRQRFLCPITDLPIRQEFLRIAEQECHRARIERRDLSLLLFDIDNFRAINSRWGHHAGDEVMADLCKMTRQFLREEDFAGRLGDGEFALLLVDTPLIKPCKPLRPFATPSAPCQVCTAIPMCTCTSAVGSPASVQRTKPLAMFSCEPNRLSIWPKAMAAIRSPRY